MMQVIDQREKSFKITEGMETTKEKKQAAEKGEEKRFKKPSALGFCGARP
ncbi:MAG: hypothetical protein GY832_42635 [Chloroflexi bacterium]|nr:hypothetical protein [Chloroflexota bacterium]